MYHSDHNVSLIALTSYADPEQIWSIVGILPWHADTLLQMSEVYRHREGLRSLEYNMAVIETFFQSIPLPSTS